jgi:DNA-binding transcriptional MocR family regulator
MTKLKNNGISRSSIVYKRLKKKIISGEIQPNTPLTEEALADEYEVSRTPIREALNRLAQDDLRIVTTVSSLRDNIQRLTSSPLQYRDDWNSRTRSIERSFVRLSNRTAISPRKR